MNPPWDIRREGRAWSADEYRERKELLPEKLEVYDGRLLWMPEERLGLLGLLLENVGADEVVRFGEPGVWLRAALFNRKWPLSSRFSRWMFLLFGAHIATIAGLIWYLAIRHQGSNGRLAELLLGICLGVMASLGVNAFLAD